MRLNTDSIFGFKPRPVSSGTEIMVLVIEGWFHWLLLQIAGAIIVSRALLPHRQMVFAHACVADTDKELTVRLTLVRHGVALMQPSIRLQICDNTGTYKELPIKGIVGGHTARAALHCTRAPAFGSSFPLLSAPQLFFDRCCRPRA